MQIDLHHAMTWVVARDAGFSPAQANTIAHAAQYVDDATNYGHIEFDNGAAYERIATAHKMLEYRNLDSLKNMKVWVPFHFLPGNGGLPAGENPSGSFIQKLVCRPHSHVAKDMIAEVLADKDRPYSLHRLGITAHVFIDTWGHKGFAGVDHPVNHVRDITDHNGQIHHSLIDKVTNYFANILQDNIPSLGHGQALSHPDLPHQHWSYTNGLGEHIERNNPSDFLQAADELCKVFQTYLVKPITGLSPQVRNEIAQCFDQFVSDNGETRHHQWLDAIANDRFGLGAYQLSYIAKGHGSWKHQALGTTLETGDEHCYQYHPGFLNSDWKHFHDAAKKHRQSIIVDILPRYGICVS
ncbi:MULTISPECIES: DUF6765 family protein [unclassified Pseudoalteromonas]|uniref:Uncharacterized protein n=2 Tax=Pseudoalteromonas rubra TaxID=43658 RepID=A0A5S3WSD4_9GAMM|nr:DUF6765 family protein [Pseudoalteromonas sp. XMcav2-N]MCO7188428.1 hypothetical protein [Pseudoalteromonas sp. XMcav2-N]TMP31296.1 hypothetical protein CWB98_22585 [Pseudoalteromonas rubra]